MRVFLAAQRLSMDKHSMPNYAAYLIKMKGFADVII